MKGLPYRYEYINGHGVARVNTNGLAISKLIRRCETRREARELADRWNQEHVEVQADDDYMDRVKG
jgi:hypothetical protein